MSTSTYIHYVTDSGADHNPSIPTLALQVYVKGSQTYHTVTFFMDDAVLAERLAQVINDAARERREDKAAARLAEHDGSNDDEEVIF